MNTNLKIFTWAFVGLLLLMIGCESFRSKPTPTSCGWDQRISSALGDTAAKAWRVKWDYQQQSGDDNIFVPDSFYVSRKVLKKLVGKSCGFYAIYGLTDTNNISTMCITLSPINKDQDSVLFLDASSVIPVSSTNQSEIKAKYISKKKAKKYHRLWQLYNGICLQGDTLGNNKCEKLISPGEIPPGGKLGEGYAGRFINQVVPISQAYDAQKIFHVLDSAYKNYDGIYFVCALMPSEFLESVSEIRNKIDDKLITLRYDFVLKADVVMNGIHTSQPFPTVKNQNGDDVEIERSCPCPGNPCCPPNT